ncbi:MAG TPA: hypothetical protein VFW25_00530 [Silvibacterium sp.]|nr:hypothetical protein [Silvibacterium sp.]
MLPLSVSLLAFGQSASQPAQQSTGTQQSAPAQQPTTPTLQLRDLPAEPHTPTPQEQAEQQAARMRMQLTRIASAQANWGPSISMPGMSLELKETDRKQTAAGTELTYQITGKGFTPDMQLTLVRWPLNQNTTPLMSGIVMDASGTAICSPAPRSVPPPAGPASAAGAAAPTPSVTTAPVPPPANSAPACSKTITPGTPVTLTTTVAKGEAIRVALVTDDRKHGAAVSLVPFPIEGSDKGCKISVTLGSKNAELVLVRGEGFTKEANYTLGSESFGEKRPLSVAITPQGGFVAAMTPWVTGHDAGDTVVYYQSSTCSPTISFHWGKDSYKPQ